MTKQQLLNEMVFAGIGARKTLPFVKHKIDVLGMKLAQKKWKLRSGGQPVGCDGFFESAYDRTFGTKEIIVPYDGFAGRWYPNVTILDKNTSAKAEVIAKEHDILDWESRSRGQKAMFIRNVAVILGPKLNNPVKFVLCYTENGEEKGGTGHAIRIAHSHNIPVINMGDPFMKGEFAVDVEVVKITNTYDKKLQSVIEKEDLQAETAKRLAMIERMK